MEAPEWYSTSALTWKIELNGGSWPLFLAAFVPEVFFLFHKILNKEFFNQLLIESQHYNNLLQNEKSAKCGMNYSSH